MIKEAVPSSEPEPKQLRKASSLAKLSLACGILGICLVALCLLTALSVGRYHDIKSVPDLLGWAFLLGYMSFFPGLFIACAAILLAIVSLKRVRTSKTTLIHDRRLALSGLLLGVIALVLAPVFREVGMERANRTSCRSLMRSITFALKAAAIDDVRNNKFPPNLSWLVKNGYISETRIFNDPSGGRRRALAPEEVDEKSDYVYLVGGLVDDNDSDLVVLYCRSHGSSWRNVTYADGHLEWKRISEEELLERAAAQRAARLGKQDQ